MSERGQPDIYVWLVNITRFHNIHMNPLNSSLYEGVLRVQNLKSHNPYEKHFHRFPNRVLLVQHSRSMCDAVICRGQLAVSRRRQKSSLNSTVPPTATWLFWRFDFPPTFSFQLAVAIPVPVGQVCRVSGQDQSFFLAVDSS